MAESAQIKRVGKPWQEALAEFFIVNPEKSMAEAAQFFGVTLAWLSTVKNSDAFQDYYAARRREHFDDVSKSLADAKITDKLQGLAEMGVDALSTRLEEHITKVPTRELSVDALLAASKLALNALGFGQAKASPATPMVQNNTIIVGAAALAKAKGNLRVIRERIIDPVIEATRPQEVMDGTAERISESTGEQSKQAA
jgi:hypothetical protein